MARLLLYSCIVFLAISGSNSHCFARNIDSLRQIISERRYKSPEEHLSTLQRICDLYVEFDLLKARETTDVLLLLSQKYGMVNYEGSAYETIGRILYLQGKIDSSIVLFKRAIERYGKLPNGQEQLMEASVFLANSYRVAAQFDESLALYNRALKHYEEQNDKIKTAKILANIGSLYYTAGNQAMGEECTLKALEIQRKLGDTQSECVSLVNLVVFALNNGDYQKGVKYGEEAIAKLKPINITYYASALIRVGYCYYMLGNKAKALDYTRESIEVSKRNSNMAGMMEGYRTLGDFYYDMKNYALAKETGLEALSNADTSNRLDLRLIYDLLKRASIYLNQHEDAINYSQLQIRMKEEDLNKEWTASIADANAKYQVQKKDSEIVQLHASQRIRITVIVSLLLLIILGSLGALLFLKNIRNKRKLAEQRVLQLEQEKQLVATQSVLEGENAERVRISKDLHDGLGGLLTVAKHKIATMRGNLTIPEEHVPVFNSALETLDSSIRELRRVAHNLMPESLLRHGLSSAIRDFCASAERVTYHFFGHEQRVDEKLEVAAFRIVSELANNAMKHAEADQINVQLIQEQDRLSINVYDNGKGFDPKTIDKSHLGGLSNVESRVISFQGHMDIISAPGKGTEVSVVFQLA